MPAFCNFPKRKFNNLPNALGARLGSRIRARAVISRPIRFINRSPPPPRAHTLRMMKQ
jgi:hypothetical protein